MFDMKCMKKTMCVSHFRYVFLDHGPCLSLVKEKIVSTIRRDNNGEKWIPRVCSNLKL